MGWLDDLKNRVWLELEKARRAKSIFRPVIPVVSPSPGSGSPRRLAGRVIGNPIVQGAADVGLEVASGKDPGDAVINVGAGMAASAAASKALPKSPWFQIPGTIGAYMVGSGTTDWINQNLVKPMFAADEEAPARIPAVTYDSSGAPIGGIGGGNAGPSVQPALGPAPAVRRPPEERHPPVSQVVPPTSAPQSQEQIRKAVEAEMLAKAANQERTAELMRSMIELGVTGGMTGDNMREWVSKNPVLAQNLIKDRLGRKERLAKEFAGFADYAQ